MKIFSAMQLRDWDAYTTLHEPISSINLMERAAHACVNWLKQRSYLITNKPVKIFCAKGNNGGDGLAIARLLLQDGINVEVYILEFGNKGTDDFQVNLQRLHAITTAINFIQSEDFFPSLDKHDLVIDAIFGTGLNKPIHDFTANLVHHINRSGVTVISIDIPSGMFADKSCKDLPVIQADFTLSFQTYKTCFLMAENESAFGTIQILPIGLNKDFEKNTPSVFSITDLQTIRSMYRPRKKFAHKGSYGHSLIIAGSYGKSGAAVLAAKSCLRSGTGLLTMHIPENSYTILQTTVPEAMVTTGALSNLQNYTSIGIGPGLGIAEDAVQLFIETISIKYGTAMIIDADALNILAAHSELLHKLHPQTILTPHPKEFDRLFGPCENDFMRMEKALQKAAQHNCYIVLKGHHTFIATPEGYGYFNSTGNAGMATAGSGDVLTGILTGLAAQQYTPLETCLLGVYLHGLAGDMAAKKNSMEAMIASDITASLGRAFNFIRQEKLSREL